MNQQLLCFKRLVIGGVFLSMSILLLPSAPVLACTTACTPDLKTTGPIIVKSFDWDNPDGLVVVNPTNMNKTAMGVKNPKKWVTKYSSVTFNQWGLNMPIGGMNEKGLVVEGEKVGKTTDYPEAKTQDGKALNQLQWIQYILDTSDSLNSAVKNAKDVYVVPSYSDAGKKLFDIDGVHYQVCNKKGECKSFEYRDGKLVVSSLHAWKGVPKETLAQGEIPYGPDTVGKDNAVVNGPLVPVLANNVYEKDSTCLAEYMNVPDGQECYEVAACQEECGNIKGNSNSNKSPRRFILAAANAQAPKGITSAKKAFAYGFKEIAGPVCNADTQWQIVYLPKDLKVKWRTMDGNTDPEKCKARHKGFGSVDLGKEKRNCTQGIKIFDLDGSVSKKPYQEITYFPTPKALDEQALYLNFKHSRFHVSEKRDKERADGLSWDQLRKQSCNPL